MGAFFVNYQIKSPDQAAVVATAATLVQGRAYISPPINGWVTLYDETSEQQDAYQIGQLGSELSAKLETVVFAFLVSDSTLFVYYLFDNGDLLDEYNSAPVPTSADAEPDQKFRFIGRPEILLNYCLPGTSRRDIETALLRSDSLVEGGFARSINAEQRLQPFAKALQMDEVRTTLGFNDFERRQVGLAQWKDFQKIDGQKSRRSTTRRIPPPVPPRPR